MAKTPQVKLPRVRPFGIKLFIFMPTKINLWRNFLINLQFYRRKIIYTVRIKSLLPLLLLLTGSTFVQAQVKYSNEFMQIGVGASEMSQGGAVVARTNTEAAGYWNPAGLLNTKNPWSIGAMHAEYFAGIAQYDYVGGQYRISDSLVVGASFIRFGVDDIPNTTNLVDEQGNFDYSRITKFSAADYAFLLHAASPLFVKNLKVGATAKIIYRQIGNMAQAYGFGFDVGLQYQYKKWELGAVAKDVTGTFNAWSFTIDDTTKAGLLASGNELPKNDLEVTLPRLVFGIARNFQVFKDFSLGAEANLVITTDGKRSTLIRTNVASLDPLVGIEADFKKRIFLRFGVNNMQRITEGVNSKEFSIQPNLGLGLRLGHWFLDYALTNIGSASGTLYSNLFTLSYRIPQIGSGEF